MRRIYRIAPILLQLREPQSLSVLAEANSLYDRALRLDPNLTDALMGRELVVMATLDLDPHADHDRLVHELDEMSLRLIAVAERQARAWNFRADALQRQWRWDAALEANARAQKLDPPRTDSIGQRADILVDMGKPDEALARLSTRRSRCSPVARPSLATFWGRDAGLTWHLGATTKLSPPANR